MGVILLYMFKCYVYGLNFVFMTPNCDTEMTDLSLQPKSCYIAILTLLFLQEKLLAAVLKLISKLFNTLSEYGFDKLKMSLCTVKSED